MICLLCRQTRSVFEEQVSHLPSVFPAQVKPNSFIRDIIYRISNNSASVPCSYFSWRMPRTAFSNGAPKRHHLSRDTASPMQHFSFFIPRSLFAFAQLCAPVDSVSLPSGSPWPLAGWSLTWCPGGQSALPHRTGHVPWFIKPALQFVTVWNS